MATTPMKATRFLTVPEVAEELGLSIRWVWARIADRQLTVTRLGGATRIRREDLEQFIADRVERAA